MDEVLRTVPGVQILTSGSPGKLSTVRIRGANPTQVQVLIDGVRVKSATSGDFDFADLTLDDIDAGRGPAGPAVDPLRRGRDRRRGQHHHEARAGAALGVPRPRGRQLRDLPGAGRRVRERGALELLPRREPARLRRPVRQRRPRPHQRERADRLRAAEQGRAVAHRAIPGQPHRHPVRHGLPGLRSEPRAEPAARAPVARVAPALDVHLGASPPGVGRRRDPRVQGQARSRAPLRLSLGHLHPADRGGVVPLRQDRAVEHDHGRRRVPERGGRGQGQLRGDGRFLGASSSRTRSRCSTACTSPGASATTATACSRTRRRPAWRPPIS